MADEKEAVEVQSLPTPGAVIPTLADLTYAEKLPDIPQE